MLFQGWKGDLEFESPLTLLLLTASGQRSVRLCHRIKMNQRCDNVTLFIRKTQRFEKQILLAASFFLELLTYNEKNIIFPIFSTKICKTSYKSFCYT